MIFAGILLSGLRLLSKNFTPYNRILLTFYIDYEVDVMMTVMIIGMLIGAWVSMEAQDVYDDYKYRTRNVKTRTIK